MNEDTSDTITLEIFRLIFSPSGATIIVILVVAFVVVYTLRKIERKLIGGMKWTGPLSTGFEVNSPQQSKPSETTVTEVTSDSVASQPTETERLKKESLTKLEEGNLTSQQNPSDPYWEMVFAGFQGNLDEIIAEYEKLKRQPGEHSEEDIETTFYLARLRAGDVGAIEELEKLEGAHKTWRQPSRRLAEYYLRIEAEREFEKHLKVLIARSDGEQQLATARILEAEGTDKFKSADNSIASLHETLASLRESKPKARILEAIADRLHNSKRYQDSIHYLVAAVRENPLDRSLRFKLAYAAAEREESRLISLQHYERLLEQDRKYPSTSNNLGILWGDLGLPAKKMRYLRTGADNKEALPVRNLVSALANEGFIAEAREHLERYKSAIEGQDDYTVARSAISNVEDREEKRSRELRESQSIEQDFYSELPMMAVPDVVKSNADWKDSVGQKYSFIVDGSLRLSWAEPADQKYEAKFLNQNHLVLVGSVVPAEKGAGAGTTILGSLLSSERGKLVIKAVSNAEIRMLWVRSDTNIISRVLMPIS